MSTRFPTSEQRKAVRAINFYGVPPIEVRDNGNLWIRDYARMTYLVVLPSGVSAESDRGFEAAEALAVA